MHKLARLTPMGRLRMVRRLEAGARLCDVAVALDLSTTSVRRWWRRYQQEGIAGLTDRSSRPHRSPNRAGSPAAPPHRGARTAAPGPRAPPAPSGTMTRTRKGWSYSVGEWGNNRVRAFEHPKTGRIFLEFAEYGQRKRIALGHRHPEAAKTKAEEVALALRGAEHRPDQALTLQTLFDNYLCEVTPRKSGSSQQHDRRATKLFLEHFGSQRKVATLSRRDWDAFIQRRLQGSDGRVGKVKGKPVRARVVTQNLKTLRAILNWATMASDGSGGYLLERDPLKGLPFPKEQSTRRPIITGEQFQAMLKVSRTISPLFELALVLAHETGHRIGSTRLLKWSDVAIEAKTIRWRGENDKIGLEHVTWLTPAALQGLEQAGRERPVIGEAWVFGAPGDASQPVSRHLMRDWWQQGEALAKVPRSPGLGWHSLRRKFATELKHVPLKDLCYLGGWKEPQTVLKCYQRADADTMKQALATRKPLQAASL